MIRLTEGAYCRYAVAREMTGVNLWVERTPHGCTKQTEHANFHHNVLSNYSWKSVFFLGNLMVFLAFYYVIRVFEWSWTFALPRTNIVPERWWLEDYFAFGKVYFQSELLVFREDIPFFCPGVIQPIGQSTDWYGYGLVPRRVAIWSSTLMTRWWNWKTPSSNQSWKHWSRIAAR